MLRPVRFASLCALFLLPLVSADILWESCNGIADHPTIVKGNFFNLCIRDHVFSNEDHAWTFTKTNIGDTVFDSCNFDNTKEKTSNYTEAVWSNVEFRSCRFGSFIENPMIFDQTTMNNVVFKDCTFHSSVDIVFSRFLFNNVTFDNCKFESNFYMELGEANDLNFIGSSFKRSDHATTPSGTDSITIRLVTLRGLTVKDSEFVTPLRFEGVSGADLDFNDTTINDFHCHSPPKGKVKIGEEPKIEYKSQFNDSAFQTVVFNGDVTCDRTLWRGLFMNEITMYKNADFSYNNVLDLDWDDVSLKSEDGTCYELDFSFSRIERKVLANTTASCKVNFEETVFETVLIRNFFGKKPSFKNAIFQEQEYVDGHCCTRACRPLGCKCDVKEPSNECPVGTREVNLRVPPTCFPADAIVKRHDGLAVRMEDLSISERIAVGGGEYSDVFFFGHRSPEAETEFVSIRHSTASRPLRMSPGHYLYVNGNLRTAGVVKPGDRLRGSDGEDNLLVTEVKTEIGRGLYAPTSMHGDLLVEGVVVSSYTNAVHPSVAHKLLHPLRLLYRYGFDSVLSRMTFLHERSLAGFSQTIGIPRGPDIVEV